MSPGLRLHTRRAVRGRAAQLWSDTPIVRASYWPLMPERRYDLEDRLMRFGAAVCRLTGHFPPTAVAKHLALQIVRSSTSPFANYGEVQGAESRRDFIHKLGICVKERRETRAWLKFASEMDLCPADAIANAARECDELLAILASSIKTARRNGRNPM